MSETPKSHHRHDSDTAGPSDHLSFDERMGKLLAHWSQHTGEHADDYRKWAKKAVDANMNDIGRLLTEAADMTIEIQKKFQAALAQVGSRQNK